MSNPIQLEFDLVQRKPDYRLSLYEWVCSLIEAEKLKPPKYYLRMTKMGHNYLDSEYEKVYKTGCAQ